MHTRTLPRAPSVAHWVAVGGGLTALPCSPSGLLGSLPLGVWSQRGHLTFGFFALHNSSGAGERCGSTGCERNCHGSADRTKGPPDAPGGDAIPRLLNSGAATSSGRPRIQTACQKLKPVSSSGFLQFQHKRHAGESRRHDRADHAQLLLARPRSAILCRAPCGHCSCVCDQQGRRHQGLVVVPCCPLTMRRLR